ncbi:hypothetical protein XENOCAPTIV_016899 [Xenoophorus captivus]|uniref:Uncharacterized protein n=1 Tax=Xenoophorus captivus TaxID=1517983 RepID=A0ABV0S7D8_9TELE
MVAASCLGNVLLPEAFIETSGEVSKKANQLHFLCKLIQFGEWKKMMTIFCNSMLESAITFAHHFNRQPISRKQKQDETKWLAKLLVPKCSFNTNTKGEMHSPLTVSHTSYRI